MYSVKWYCSKDDLQIARQDYLGTNLRMDGIFYNKH